VRHRAGEADVASKRGLPVAPSDPGEDWARAIAEMTGEAEATDGAAAETTSGAAVATAEATASAASAAATRTDGTVSPADSDPDAAAGQNAVADTGPSEVSAGEATAEETTAGEATAGEATAADVAAREAEAEETTAGETTAETTAGTTTAADVAAREPTAGETSPGGAVVAEPKAKPELAPGRRQRQRLVLAAMLGAATVVVGAVGIWAAVAAHSLRASAADANRAFTDAAATRTVDHQVAAAVNTIFSYSYADSARTRAAAQGLLTGAAITQYDQLFAIVQKDAPKAKLTVTTRVTNIGIELLTGDRARVLIFANQQSTSAGTAKSTYGGAMFAVTAVNQHGKWKIESIDTFTGPA
jgi:Mce-associated membrane protein